MKTKLRSSSKNKKEKTLVTIVESVRAAKKHFFETNNRSRNSTEKTKTLYHTFPSISFFVGRTNNTSFNTSEKREREHTHTCISRVQRESCLCVAPPRFESREQRDDKNAAKNIIQNEQHPRRGDEEEEGEGGEEDKKERDHRRLTKNEASDASKDRAKRAMRKKLLEYDPASKKKKKSKDDDDPLFEQKQYQTIQWLKNGGWRSGRLSKGRFIVEKGRR